MKAVGQSTENGEERKKNYSLRSVSFIWHGSEIKIQFFAFAPALNLLTKVIIPVQFTMVVIYSVQVRVFPIKWVFNA